MKITGNGGAKLLDIGEVTLNVTIDEIKKNVTHDEVVEMAAEKFAANPVAFMADIALKANELDGAEVDVDENVVEVKAPEDSSESRTGPTY